MPNFFVFLAGLLLLWPNAAIRDKNVDEQTLELAVTSSSIDGWQCCCRMGHHHDWEAGARGEDGLREIFHADIDKSGPGFCLRKASCKTIFYDRRVQVHDSFCTSDKAVAFDDFIHHLNDSSGCKSQLRAYADAIDARCHEGFDLRHSTVKLLDCPKLAEDVVHALFLSGDTNFCQYLVNFRKWWKGRKTPDSNSLLIWNAVNHRGDDSELAQWSVALEAHNDHETYLSEVLDTESVNGLSDCEFRNLVHHWSTSSVCLFHPVGSKDMLHILNGRVLCADEGQVRCYEQTFQYEHELPAAGRHGSFYAIQVWALRKGSPCSRLIPAVYERISSAVPHDGHGVHLWRQVNYLACADVEKPPTAYRPKQPVGVCYKKPFHNYPGKQELLMCKWENLKSAYQLQEDSVLSRALASRSAETIAYAIGNLGIAGKPFAPAVAELLDERNSEVRKAAADALGKLGPEAGGPFAPQVAELLEDSDYGIRKTAAEALGKLGPAAGGPFASQVAELCKDSDWRVRRAAADALGKLGPEAGGPFASQVAELLQDSDEDVRRAAAGVLGNLGPGAGGRFAPRVAELLKESDWKVRYAAADALGKLQRLMRLGS
eukprot:TRINITY_DN18176_c0_g1_i10.p1 TRINITY_DN18176_c0_g1~~TRINITY_DN18176_c0_g1_i10.p1  ORF type:complete len:602 (-),score=95.61 TRINITY_DN18176_c0_g1_i10:195-2000(-)